MKKSLLASGLRLSFLTMISRLLGLVREMTKASFLGTSALADAFGVAFLIPNLLRRLFAENSISVAFIPTFRAWLEDKTKGETQEFLNAVCTITAFFTSLIALAGIAAAPFIVPFFLSGSSGENLSETALLTRIMFPYLTVISVAAFFQGILNGLKIFSPSGFTPILFNLIVIGCTYALSPFTANPARAMSIGVLLGGSVQMLFQLPFVLKTGWRVSFTSLKKAFANEGTKRVIRLIGPTIIGMAAYQLNDIVSTALAGHAGTGVVSSLQYSLRLQELILGIFAVTIGTVILPDLSAFAQKKLWPEFNSMLNRAVQIIALITIPVTFFSLATGESIITLIYKNNRFTDESVRLTFEAFLYHIAGLFFIALNRVVAPAFYAQGNTKSPTAAGIFGFGLNIVLAGVLVFPMKGAGIALALSLASLGNTAALFYFLRRSKTIDTSLAVRSTILYALKMILLSVLALVPLLLVKGPLYRAFAGHHRFISQGIPLGIAFLLYAFTGILLLILTRDSLVKTVIAAMKKNSRKNDKSGLK